jgi:hypothetical protein
MPAGPGQRSGHGERLTPEEDQSLRRLHWFESLGCDLSSALRTLKENFRTRDRRTSIREPGAVYDKAAADAAAKKQDSSSYWAG